MSTSSSAAALQRVADPVPEPSPFPYADAGTGGVSAGPGKLEADPHELQAQLVEQARSQGQLATRAEMAAALLQEREQIAVALRAFASERGAYYRRIEGEVVQLALAIARKVLHREVQLDPQALAGIVRITIEGMDARTKVNLHVPPHDAAEWRHYFAARMEGDLALEVLEDPALPPGECRIETAMGATEVGFDAQLKEIETGLLDLLAERPGSS